MAKNDDYVTEEELIHTTARTFGMTVDALDKSIRLNQALVARIAAMQRRTGGSVEKVDCPICGGTAIRYTRGRVGGTMVSSYSCGNCYETFNIADD